MSTVLCTVTTGKDPAGTGLVPSTHIVTMDEPCVGLSEVHIQSPGSLGFHRYQVLGVVRNNQVVQYMNDLGPAENFTAVNQFRVPGGVLDDLTGRFEVVHTVGELCDIADFLRAGLVPPPEIPEGDLWNDLLLQEEEKQRCALRASSFSQTHKIQRSQ